MLKGITNVVHMYVPRAAIVSACTYSPVVCYVIRPQSICALIVYAVDH